MHPDSEVSSQDLDKVVHLFLSEYSQALHERHIAAIDKLCKNNENGFAVRDLHRVAQILELTLQLVRQGASHFIRPLCQLVRTLKKPYVKKLSSDELKLPAVITGLLRALAGSFETGMPHQLQACAAEALAEFSSAYNNRPALLELSKAPVVLADLQTAQRLYSLHQSLLYQSNVALPLCQALKAVLDCPETCCSQLHTSLLQASIDAAGASADAEPPDLLPTLVTALVNFSYSAELCEQLLQAGLLSLLVRLTRQQGLNLEHGATSKLTVQVVELLWNLLEHAPATAGATLSVDCTSTQLLQQQQQQQQQRQWGPQGACHGEWQSAAASAGSSRNGSVSSSVSSSNCNSRPVSGVLGAPSDAGMHGPELDAGWVQAEGSGLTEDSAAAAAESAAEPGVVQQVSSWLATELINLLADLFRHQLADTSSKQAKECRNDTLTVLQQLSRIPACCPAMCSSGFLEVALAAAVVPELRQSSDLVPAGAAAKDAINHEMKLLLWSTLGNAAVADAACRTTAVDAGFLAALVAVVNDTAVIIWNSEQLATLKRLAWSVLLQVAPLCKDDFVECGGVDAIAQYVSKCYAASGGSCSSNGDATLSPGKIIVIATGETTCAKSSSGGVICSYKPGSGSSSVEPAMRLLQKLITGGTSAMAFAFASRGLVSSLLQLLQAPAYADTEWTRYSMLLVLSELCTAGGKICQMKLQNNWLLPAGGVAVVLKECERVLQSDPSIPSLPGLAALDCLWRCCVSCPSRHVRAQLLALDGLDVLLQLLYKGNKHLRPVILSILVDLLADHRSHPFFLDWHAPVLPGQSAAASTTTANFLQASLDPTLSFAASNPSITAPQLLIQIWREQDAARGISGQDGLLLNPARPLAGSGDRVSWLAADCNVAGGYCCLQPERQRLLHRIAAASSPDLLMNKVYACFAQLPADAVMGTLPPADAAVLCFIQQYVKFRQGEVWQDIRQELAAAGTQPTAEDGIRVESGIEHSQLIASRVQEQQAALLGAVKAEVAAAERAHYAAMAAQAAAEARSKLEVYQKDSSKLTMRERLAAKAHKEEMLKHSITASTTVAAMAVGGTASEGVSSAPAGSQLAVAAITAGAALAAEVVSAVRPGSSKGSSAGRAAEQESQFSMSTSGPGSLASMEPARVSLQ